MMTKEEILSLLLVELPALNDECITNQNDSPLHFRLQELKKVTSLNYSTLMDYAQRRCSIPLLYERLFPTDYRHGIIRLPEGMKSLPSDAFHLNNTIQKVYLPSSLETIGDFAFDECQYLKTVVMPENTALKSIGKQAFFKSPQFDLPYLPDHIEIGASAFHYTKFYFRILDGELPCPENVFNALSDDFEAMVLLCSTAPEKQPPFVHAYARENLQSIVDVISQCPDEFEDAAERLKKLLWLFSTKKNIGTMMDIIINNTQKNNHMELRLEMLNYQHERKLFPERGKLEL